MVVYQTKLYADQLARLLRSDRKAEQAAQQAERISALLDDKASSGELQCKRTKFGELRLANCRKYDLGGGYRLITVQGADRCVLACVGSHDTCHRWLEKQRDKALDVEAMESAGRLCPVMTGGELDPDPGNPIPCLEADQYENTLMERIDEKMLCRIFFGLGKGTSRPHAPCGDCSV